MNFSLSGQACAGAEKERIRQVQQKVFQHSEGVLQGGAAHYCVYLSHLLDPSDQHGDDDSQGQVRVVHGRTSPENRNIVIENIILCC